MLERELIEIESMIGKLYFSRLKHSVLANENVKIRVYTQIETEIKTQ